MIEGLGRWRRTRRIVPPVCVVSTQQGFVVVHGDWQEIESFPYGRGQEAFALAERLDPRATA